MTKNSLVMLIPLLSLPCSFDLNGAYLKLVAYDGIPVDTYTLIVMIHIYIYIYTLVSWSYEFVDYHTPHHVLTL